MATVEPARMIDADEMVRMVKRRQAEIKAKVAKRDCGMFFWLGELKTCDWILEEIDDNSE